LEIATAKGLQGLMHIPVQQRPIAKMSHGDETRFCLAAPL